MKNYNNYKLLRNLNYFLLAITFILAFTQIKINNYNSKIDEIEDNITNRVISGIYSNFLHLQENLISNKLFNATIHENHEVVSKLEQEILKKRIQIIKNYYSISEVPSDVQFEELVENNLITNEEKYKKLIEIYNSSQGSFQKFLDSKYSEKTKLMSQKSIYSLINYLCTLGILILSIFIASLTFNLKVDSKNN